MSLEIILTQLQALATQVPLELFVIIGSFLEEIIAPIPSPFVMTTAGSIAHAQQASIFSVIILGLLGAIAKTAGASVFYFLADKLEDVVIGKFGRFIGISHAELEGFGKHFQGGWKDDVILLVLRSLPIFPSAPVSLICGVIKLNFRTFVISSILGFWIKDLLFLGLGYAGGQSATTVLEGIDSLESIAKIGFFVILAASIGLLYYKRAAKKRLSSVGK